MLRTKAILLGALAAVLLPTITLAQNNNNPCQGTHYNLNLIGVPKGKTADMTNNDGHRIFMKLSGNTTIKLSEGDFKVLDANGTDGSAAFRLPNPDPDGDGITVYSVFGRALGKPGGSASATTCATDPVSGEQYCSIYSVVAVRSTGKSTWENVSKELLFLYADLNGDGVVERYSLFDSRLQNYFWSYDNNGLKLFQLRFCEVSTDVN